MGSIEQLSGHDDMRGKRAKALRRQAVELSGGVPRRLIYKAVQLNPRNAKKHGSVTLADGCIVNDPRSTRAVYRRLKRAYTAAQQ